MVCCITCVTRAVGDLSEVWVLSEEGGGLEGEVEVEGDSEVQARRRREPRLSRMSARTSGCQR